MSSSKNFTCKGTFSAGVYLSESQTPYTPPYTLYTYVLYTYSHRKGGGGRGEPEKKLDEQQCTKLGRKYQHDKLLYL
jgi:hypothetical protein